MGVDTKGFIDSKYKAIDIKAIVESKLGIECKLEQSSFAKSYYQLFFDYNDEKRILSIHEDYKEEDTGKIVTLFTLGMWGSSIEIITSILQNYGGWIIRNDCADEWDYVEQTSNIELNEEQKLKDKIWLDTLKDKNVDFNTKQMIIDYVIENIEYLRLL